MIDDEIPLRDSQEIEILMHRDAHFSGSFDEMIAYYEKNGVGVNPEFSLDKIFELQAIEKVKNTNLALSLFSITDMEKVGKVREVYRNLKSLYETKKNSHPDPLLIADLILSEDVDPQKEIESIVKKGSLIVPHLIELLRSHEFYDPLYPGYGRAPSFAAKALGMIGDKRAIISLFEEIGEEDYENEEVILKALKAIGPNAKEFLLHVLHARPINIDNERAAIALIEFKDDEKVARDSFEMLKDPLVLKDIPLATYLILICENLKDPKLQEELKEIGKGQNLSSSLKKDIETIAKSWVIGYD